MLLIESEEGINGVLNGKCTFCLNEQSDLFRQYYSHTFEQNIIYCRHCVGMTYSTNVTYYKMQKTEQLKEQIEPKLSFQLSNQQQYASDEIIKAVKNKEHRLLYAVTGAGKTEMILQAISYVRSQGGNVALVSPRVDVVKELAIRMNHYFDTNIDVLYAGEERRYDSHFVICTVHQLFRYREHFNLIVVDEVDAFPLPYDQRLLKVVDAALTTSGSKILLTATPPKLLMKQFKQNEIIILPARYHRRPLPVPTYKFMRTKQVMAGKLKHRLEQRKEHTYLLIFFNDIQVMKQAAEQYTDFNLVVVYAEDMHRHEKVESIRSGKYNVIFTTTILERGFTMAGLDVWVVDAGSFDSAALIQMAGRVDRKKERYDGEVIYFHEGMTQQMITAVNNIKKMNNEGRKRGWIDGDV